MDNKFLEKAYESFYQSKEFAEIEKCKIWKGRLYFYDKGVIRNIPFPPEVEDEDLRTLISASWKERKMPVIASFRDLPYKSFGQGTVLIDLSKNDVFSTLSKDVRWSIRKAEKEGVQVRLLKTPEELEEFASILKTLEQRKEKLQINIEKLSKVSKLYARAYGAFIGDRMIAGGFFYRIGKIFMYDSGAALPEFYKHQPVSLYLWRAVEDAKKDKFEIFDLGGYDVNAAPGSERDRINKFKKEWGELVVYNHYIPYFLVYYVKKLKELFFNKR
jgi:lipid II:glycine glycyltransferase (peptidoglycan interpeptide bridge formation enzyme)